MDQALQIDKGFEGLYKQVGEVFGENPFSFQMTDVGTARLVTCRKNLPESFFTSKNNDLTIGTENNSHVVVIGPPQVIVAAICGQ